MIAKYGTEEESRHDLLSLLMSSRDAETGATMSAEQVRDEVIAIMSAGTETSATTLTWIFHELGRHPEVEKRLHAEIDDVIGGGPVEPGDLPRLAYTNSVFQETLRLHSPLLFTRRALAPVTLGGVRITRETRLRTAPMPSTVTRDCSRNPPLSTRSGGAKWLPHAFRVSTAISRSDPVSANASGIPSQSRKS